MTSAEIWPELSVSYINNNFLLTRVLGDVGTVVDIVAILIYCYHSNVQINRERRIFMIASASLREGGGVLAEVILCTM